MHYTEICKAIEKVKEWGGKIAIYPYGKNGVVTEWLMKSRYGLYDYIVVDNYICEGNSKVKSLDDVKNVCDYSWVITCEDEELTNTIVKSLKNESSNITYTCVFEHRKTDVTLPVPTVVNEAANSYKDFRLLSQIIDNPGMDKACTEFLHLIKILKNEGRNLCVAEVGIGVGATAVEVCKALDKKDVYYCFDRQKEVDLLKEDLKRIENITCSIRTYGCTRKMYDSYNWDLSNLIYKMRNKEKRGLFDIVYLDGAHTFLHDGLAVCLLKELIKRNGYIIIDDVKWNYYDAGYNAEFLSERFTNEQARDNQVQRVINMFLLNDPTFEYVDLFHEIEPWRVVYRKK